MQIENAEKARKILAHHLSNPPTTSEEARVLVHMYERGKVTFPPEVAGQIYFALQVLRDENMRYHHGQDEKRQDRRDGRNRRKVRTGSRK